jgi:hypothetical protein
MRRGRLACGDGLGSVLAVYQYGHIEKRARTLSFFDIKLSQWMNRL